MGKVILNDTTLTSIADAIRNKNGEAGQYLPSEMPQKILDIQSGGGSDYNINFYYARGDFKNSDFVEAAERGDWINCYYLYNYGTQINVAGDGLNVKITDASYMYYSISPMGMTTIDCTSFNLSRCTNMEYMFYYNTWLKSLDVSNWDTSKINNMQYIFANCTNLESLDMSSLDLSNLENFANPFYYASGLKTLILPDIPKVFYFDLFGTSPKVSLQNFTFANGGTFGNQSNASSLTLNCSRFWQGKTDTIKGYYENFANSIGENTSGKIRNIKLHTTLYNDLTDEQKALLTDKGYTITYGIS